MQKTKVMKYWWRPRNGYDGKSVAKILIAIQVNLVLIPSKAEMRQHKFT